MKDKLSSNIAAYAEFHEYNEEAMRLIYKKYFGEEPQYIKETSEQTLKRLEKEIRIELGLTDENANRL